MNPYFPYTDSTQIEMVICTDRLSAKLLNSVGKKRALEIAKEVLDKWTINKADKNNWIDIVKKIEAYKETVEVVSKKPNNYNNNNKKADNAGYLKVDNPVVGKSYHVAWAHKGCVWRLIKVDGGICRLRTLKTKKEIDVKVSDLRHIRKTEFKIRKQT